MYKIIALLQYILLIKKKKLHIQQKKILAICPRPRLLARLAVTVRMLIGSLCVVSLASDPVWSYNLSGTQVIHGIFLQTLLCFFLSPYIYGVTI